MQYYHTNDTTTNYSGAHHGKGHHGKGHHGKGHHGKGHGEGKGKGKGKGHCGFGKGFKGFGKGFGHDGGNNAHQLEMLEAKQARLATRIDHLKENLGTGPNIGNSCDNRFDEKLGRIDAKLARKDIPAEKRSRLEARKAMVLEKKAAFTFGGGKVDQDAAARKIQRAFAKARREQGLRGRLQRLALDLARLDLPAPALVRLSARHLELSARLAGVESGDGPIVGRGATRGKGGFHFGKGMGKGRFAPHGDGHHHGKGHGPHGKCHGRHGKGKGGGKGHGPHGEHHHGMMMGLGYGCYDAGDC